MPGRKNKKKGTLSVQNTLTPIENSNIKNDAIDSIKVILDSQMAINPILAEFNRFSMSHQLFTQCIMENVEGLINSLNESGNSELTKNCKFTQTCLNDLIQGFNEMLVNTNNELVKFCQNNNPSVNSSSRDIYTKYECETKCQDTQTDFKPETFDTSNINIRKDIVNKINKQYQSQKSINDSMSANKEDNLTIMITKTPLNIIENDIMQAINQDTEYKNQCCITKCTNNLKHNSWVVETNANTATKILKQGTIYVKENFYRTIPYIKIIRCFKCQNFEHISKMCSEHVFCPICSEPHDSKNCQRKAKCINCTRHNLYGHNFNINHTSLSQSCPALKLYMEKKRKNLLQNLKE